MNFLKYTYNKTVKPFYAYDGWDEVPYYKFIEYKKLTEQDNHDITKVYELFLMVQPPKIGRKHDHQSYTRT